MILLLSKAKQHEKELEFYTKRLEELSNSLSFVRAEINLTERIINMIKKESVKDE